MRAISEEAKGALSYETIANALFENYESIYNVDLETGEYSVYYESDSYRGLDLTRSGSDFFTALEREVRQVIAPEDRAFVLRMLSHEKLVEGIKSAKYHSMVYRIVRHGERVYHQLRATLQRSGGRDYALMGVRNVDSVVRQNAARENELASEREKSANYLDAILATAAAYTDANLTGDRVLAQSDCLSVGEDARLGSVPSPEEIPSYTAFQEFVAAKLVCENREKYAYVSSREHLLDCFEKGIERASVPFSAKAADGKVVPCRAVFYLYRERATRDVHVLCVIYDLTEEQRLEQEMKDLKSELDLSRIRSSTSQMKPHFLYNALGSIQEVVLEDPERAADLLEDFTTFLRGCVKAMDSDDPIPFSRELENIKAYASIEKMRLGDRLEMVYDLEETSFRVLPLSIQPLVENAIRHGIHPLGKRGGVVALRTSSTERDWVVRVEDTGRGFDMKEYASRVESGAADSTGLKNIRFRLEKILGASMDVTSVEGAGTRVTVLIPKEGGPHEGDHRR